jgi:hypothetical protein
VWENVDWSHRGDYIVRKHGVSPDEADEALRDPSRHVQDPDPASESGRSVRIVGWCQTRGELLTVIVVADEGREYGVNAWRTDGQDVRKYWGDYDAE